MKNLHLFRTWCLSILAFVAAVAFAAGCGGGGIKIGSDAIDNGAGESSIEIASVGSTGNAGFGARGIVVTFDSPVTASVAAGAKALTRTEIESLITVKDAAGSAVTMNSVWADDGMSLRLYGPFRYGQTYTATAEGDDPVEVTMGPNPYNFDGDAAETADYPTRYEDSEDNVSYMLVLPGDDIAAAAGGELDPLGSMNSFWYYVLADATPTPGTRLRNIDGNGTAGFAGRGYTDDSTTTQVLWTSYSRSNVSPQVELTSSGSVLTWPDDYVPVDPEEEPGDCTVESTLDLGDVNGDGIGDIAISEICSYSKLTFYSIVHVLSGPIAASDAAISATSLESASATMGLISDPVWKNHLSLASTPADVDGDGKGDIVAVWTDALLENLGNGWGAQTVDDLVVNDSQIQVYSSSGGVASMLDAPTATISAPAWNMWFDTFNLFGERFYSVKTADVNGDGVSDIIALSVFEFLSSTADEVSDLVELRTRVSIFFGGRSTWPTSADVVIDSFDIDTFSMADGLPPTIGYSVVGDVNADGYEELLLGVKPEGGSMNLSLLYGRPTSEWESSYVVPDDADIRIVEDASYTHINALSVAAGDIDNDGHDDLIIGGTAVGDGVHRYFLFMGDSLASDLTPSDADVIIKLEKPTP